MIVRILSGSKTFHAVKYNTDKIRKHTGQLMAVKNFGVLTGLSEVRAEDYRNYLKAVSAVNAKVSKPQFHAVVSAKGYAANKDELTSIAEQWLQLMGYAFQPYLIIYHNDTENAHVHIVSTRIDRNGKKISSAYEKLRAVKNLDRVLGQDRSQDLVRDIDQALKYHFTTRAQFLLILEKQGYHTKIEGGSAIISMPGGEQKAVALRLIEDRINETVDTDQRRQQLKALFYKYGSEYPTKLEKEKAPLPGGRSMPHSGYTSLFAQYMKGTFGLEMVFHYSNDKPPYGYTIIDHHDKIVFKGGDILPLKALLTLAEDSGNQRRVPSSNKAMEGDVLSDTLFQKANIVPYPINVSFDNPDPGTGFNPQVPQFNINIADDIDDEAILGRNRRKKRKARTNTR